MRRLPSGKTTEDYAKYTRTWRRLGRKIEKLLPGYTINAYDPDLFFVAWGPKSADGRRAVLDSLTLSVRAARLLLGEEVVE